MRTSRTLVLLLLAASAGYVLKAKLIGDKTTFVDFFKSLAQGLFSKASKHRLKSSKRIYYDTMNTMGIP